MKLVYIAHPLRNDPNFNKARLSEILNNNFKSYQEMHVIPISPIHLFGYLDPGVDVMAECLELALYIAMNLWVFGEGTGKTAQELVRR